MIGWTDESLALNGLRLTWGAGIAAYDTHPALKPSVCWLPFAKELQTRDPAIKLSPVDKGSFLLVLPSMGWTIWAFLSAELLLLCRCKCRPERKACAGSPLPACRSISVSRSFSGDFPSLVPSSLRLCVSLFRSPASVLCACLRRLHHPRGPRRPVKHSFFSVSWLESITSHNGRIKEQRLRTAAHVSNPPVRRRLRAGLRNHHRHWRSHRLCCGGWNTRLVSWNVFGNADVF